MERTGAGVERLTSVPEVPGSILSRVTFRKKKKKKTSAAWSCPARSSDPIKFESESPVNCSDNRSEYEWFRPTGLLTEAR